MRELALHILDLVQNSIEAEADQVILEIQESPLNDRLVIRVTDNGRGMDAQTVQRVRDPFVTSRNTRRIGLGLPLIDMTTRNTGGYMDIRSTVGAGTVVEAVFGYRHWDRPPLGNMVETLKSILVGNPELDFIYRHSVEEKQFSLSSREVAETLDGIPLTHPDVLEWLHGFLTAQIGNLYGGAPL